MNPAVARVRGLRRPSRSLDPLIVSPCPRPLDPINHSQSGTIERELQTRRAEALFAFRYASAVETASFFKARKREFLKVKQFGVGVGSTRGSTSLPPRSMIDSAAAKQVVHACAVPGEAARRLATRCVKELCDLRVRLFATHFFHHKANGVRIARLCRRELRSSKYRPAHPAFSWASSSSTRGSAEDRPIRLSTRCPAASDGPYRSALSQRRGLRNHRLASFARLGRGRRRSVASEASPRRRRRGCQALPRPAETTSRAS